MKTKFSLVWRVATALVMVLSLGLVMAAPASADVSQPTVAVDPPLTGEVAQYTIGFDINTSLPIAGTITVTFPEGTTVPATYADGDVTVQGASVSSGNISGDATSRVVTITLATAIAAPATVTVVFTTAADIVNPSAGEKTLTVETSAEDVPVTSETYTILALPAVTGVAPEVGNVGDTMWVEVTGSDFTGDPATNDSTTTLDFGGGITVVSTKFIGTGEIDVQITITAPGAVSVAATTAAGTGAVTYTFTANDAGTAQVDVWNTYDITATIFNTNTLVFDTDAGNPFDTITAALVAADADDTLIVHAATYNEQVAIPIGRDRLTLEGNSATDTIIQAPSGNITTINVASPSVTIRGFWIKAPLGTNQEAIISLGADAASSQGAPGVIEDNKIDSEGVRETGAFARIVLLEATDWWEIKDNEFVGDRSSIAFNGADNILVSGNSFSDGGVGSTESSDNITISGNQFLLSATP